jgi:hypothetical protein
LGLEQCPHRHRAAARDAVAADSDKETIDIRRQTERERVTDIAEQERKSGDAGKVLFDVCKRVVLTLEKSDV